MSIRDIGVTARPIHAASSSPAQKRGVFGVIKRELRRRCAIEAVIGHMNTDGHLGRCHLKGRRGDAANVILTAVGHNLRLVLAWLRPLCRLIVLALRQASQAKKAAEAALPLSGRGRNSIRVAPPISLLAVRLEQAVDRLRLLRVAQRHSALGV